MLALPVIRQSGTYLCWNGRVDVGSALPRRCANRKCGQHRKE